MKKTLLFLVFLLAGLLSHGQSNIQQVVAPAGGNGLNDDMQIGWTLGETVIATVTDDNINLTQGFQQPNLVVTALKKQDTLPFTVDAYPNPTGNMLMIQIENTETGDFQYVLYNMNGKVLERQKITATITTIGMNNHPAGMYLLKITQHDLEIMMFEIIKN
jgi:hypothetical protein